MRIKCISSDRAMILHVLEREINETAEYSGSPLFSYKVGEFAFLRNEGISGCSTKSRVGFRTMIADCEAGEIDLVITKSISRFARNTQDSLNYTRRLKERGIGVYFEKEEALLFCRGCSVRDVGVP